MKTGLIKLVPALLIVYFSGFAFADDTSIPVCPDGNAPRFEDYAVKPETLAGRATLKLNNEFSRMFQTRLQDGLRDNPIALAGHYIVVTFSCGSSCLYGGFVDAQTGQATALPFALDSFGVLGVDDPLLTRADSRLVVMRGIIRESGTPPLVIYYQWTGQRLQPVCSLTLKPLPVEEETR